MLQDESFLAQLKQGVPAAYALLVEQFEGPLYRFFYCNHRDHHLAQDQTAETFAQLVQSLRGMRGSSDQLRGLRLRDGASCSAASIPGKETAVRSARWGPLHRRRQAVALWSVAADREQLERVLDAISQLEDPLPDVLLLRFVEGCSIEEVAQALELPVGTVKSHIHRSRTRLKQIFAERECET